MINLGIISRPNPANVYDVQFGFGPITEGRRPKSFIPWQSDRDDVLTVIEKHADLVRRAIATNRPIKELPSRVVTIVISDQERHAHGGGGPSYKEFVRAKLMSAGGDPDEFECRAHIAGRSEFYTTKRTK